MSEILRQLPECSQRSVIRGCRKYERALIHGDVPRRLDGKVREQFEHFGAAMENMAQVMTMVRQVLCCAGVQPARFMIYYNFALHVARLKNADVGAGRDALAGAAVLRWIARGCERAVLERICVDVFNVNPPETKPDSEPD
jgi:hypothetical protein